MTIDDIGRVGDLPSTLPFNGDEAQVQSAKKLPAASHTTHVKMP